MRASTVAAYRDAGEGGDRLTLTIKKGFLALMITSVYSMRSTRSKQILTPKPALQTLTS
jgi:hypothetical protein